VKAAALLHLARVLTAFDKAEAERVLDTGIALAFEVPKPAGDALLTQAVTLAAAVSPQRALRLMPLVAAPWHRSTDRIIFNMLRHGHIADAVSYLSDPPPMERYPFSAAIEAIGHSGDEETRRKVLRAAIRARLGESSSWADGFEFLFALWWLVLPVDEAAALVREIVQRTIEERDGEIEAKFSSGWNVARFSSVRESRLFGIFGPLRHLDAKLADELCRKYPQLAAAVVPFPRGYYAEAEAPPEKRQDRQSAERCEQPDYITAGQTRLLPIPEALKTEFREPFDEALRLYARDTDLSNPNRAPRECWPSAMEFRNILYKAGPHEGRAAARHLNRVPDRDLRLFAQIELIAAIAGLPQFGGMIVPPHRLPKLTKDRWIM